MTMVFADSFYFFALLNARDAAHEKAVDFSSHNSVPIVTTAWILTEVADGLSRYSSRRIFKRLVERLEGDGAHLIVPSSEELFYEGIELYNARSDKAWSLTDCISFRVMSELQIREALTGDHHFEQAGFVALLS